MIDDGEARWARESLREIGDQIDGGDIEASDTIRAYIAGAVHALDSVEIEPSGD